MKRRSTDKLEQMGYEIIIAVGMHPDNGHMKMAASSGFRQLEKEDFDNFVYSLAQALLDLRELPMDDLGIVYNGPDDA